MVSSESLDLRSGKCRTPETRDSHCCLALTNVLKGRETVNVQSNLRIGDVCLVASVARSYYTALELISDAQRAEALVVEAIESLDPETVTGETLRDAVVEVLVRAQMMSSEHSAT